MNNEKSGELVSEVERRYWKIENKLKGAASVPQELCHYTSAAGLIGILNSGGLYASPYFSLNDPSELKYGLSILREVAEGLLISSNSLEVRFGNAILSSQEMTKGEFGSHFPVLLIISFSAEMDNLSQWRSYSSDGNGYCLVLDTSKIAYKSDGPNFVGSWAFYECDYDKISQLKKVKLLLDEIIDSFRILHPNPTDDEIVKYSMAYMWQLFATLKHPAFRDEKEWRVVQTDSQNSLGGPFEKRKMEVYTNGIHIKTSFLTQFTNHNAVSKVMMGPRNNFQSAKYALEILLLKTAYTGNGVTIHESNAPYR